MVARITTFSFSGIEAKPVDVQVHMAGANQPVFTIVGLPDKAVAESKERVRAAFSAIGLALPPKRITVNLAPADLPKEGSHYDLAIALGTMAVMDILPGDVLSGHAAIGTAEMAERVRVARSAQLERYNRDEWVAQRPLNVDANADALAKFAEPDEPGRALISDAAVKLNLSARAYHRVLKVARTIADLEGATAVRRVHVAEALSYRRRPPRDANTAHPNALAQ